MMKSRNGIKQRKEPHSNSLKHTSEPVELSIDRLSDDGRGIALYQGKTFFVEGALDGETVWATFTKHAHKYIEGRVKEIVTTSAERIQPPCPVFSRCGGCSVQHMPSNKQLAFKQNSVLSQLSRWAGVTPAQLLPAIIGSDYGYRQRVRLAVDYLKSGEVLLGFRESASHRLVNVTQCDVLEPQLQAVLPVLKEWLLYLKPNVVGHIELVNTEAAIGIVVRHTRQLSNESRQKLDASLVLSVQEAGVASYVWFQADKGAVLEDATGVPVSPRLHYSLKGKQPISLGFHPQDFIQSNKAINQAMVSQAVELLAPQSHEHIVDLFCGIGNFSLSLAQHAKWVTAIEGVDLMVERARDNALNNDISNISFVAKDLTNPKMDIRQIVNNKTLGENLPIDGLLLDPPRAGAKEICQNIMKLSPKRVVYVSCDSSTFARDAKILVDNGYQLHRLGVMDMFPQTSHVEVMALFMQSNVKSAAKSQRKRRTSKLRLR